MAFTVSTYAGGQQIATADTTQNHPLGTIVRGHDPTYGEGEFIYCKGVASTIVGSIVEYDTNFQTGLSTTALNLPRPVAVAMSICTASYYGWYQIGGIASMAKLSTTSFAAAAALAASAGLAIAAATGRIMNGALVTAVASAVSVAAPDLVTVMINRPHDPSDVS
jgi:hypothetical protein